MSMDLTDGESTLVQVMAWCHQATSHYLSQCWPRSLSTYDVTRPQWVNWPIRSKIQNKIWIKMETFSFKKTFENVCKMAAILFKPYSLGSSNAIQQNNFVDRGSGDDLLPDGTKPSAETMLTYHQWSPVLFNWGQFIWKLLEYVVKSYI